jgi:hypothetical protein
MRQINNSYQHVFENYTNLSITCGVWVVRVDSLAPAVYGAPALKTAPTKKQNAHRINREWRQWSHHRRDSFTWPNRVHSCSYVIMSWSLVTSWCLVASWCRVACHGVESRHHDSSRVVMMYVVMMSSRVVIVASRVVMMAGCVMMSCRLVMSCRVVMRSWSRLVGCG